MAIIPRFLLGGQDGGFNTDTSTYTSPREIRNVVRRLRNGKAVGDDAINNSLLKNLSCKALVFLTFLFNGCLEARETHPYPKAQQRSLGPFKLPSS
jgi:hypothetical protein